ncbi:subtilase-type protease inhibitor [Streptacidiphilus sp. ASG 303]|uniref:SSI family serine proteinase inhibitor n=1 Tax=Streptacidiphilus sp. ASG 303 TaxID=2896847 RepID=UPI001E4978D6|nr:SSI family serine proteinase inhibitor [Streptacidiphilus sp. ASG 303]MCD0481122.1 subtilase-type protease inhibitor [Streptacidiphilus sp. ASG 303]
MRNRTRTAAAAAALLAATAALTGAGRASAAPTGLYAPSALVLTMAPGDGTDPDASVARAVTLGCAPAPSGTHPAAADACAGLAASDGSFAGLRGYGRPCPAIATPVTVTADGVWRGKRVSYRETFGNYCAVLTSRGTVFDF